MRAVVFRVPAGVLAVAFLVLLASGGAAQMSPRDQVGVIGVGLGLYAGLGSDLGERLIGAAFGARDPGARGRAPGTGGSDVRGPHGRRRRSAVRGRLCGVRAGRAR